MVCACLFPFTGCVTGSRWAFSEGLLPVLAEVTNDPRDAVLNVRLPCAYFRLTLA